MLKYFLADNVPPPQKDNGEVHETEFSDCLHTIENEVERRRRR